MDRPTPDTVVEGYSAQTVDEFAGDVGDADARPEARRENGRAPSRREWTDDEWAEWNRWSGGWWTRTGSYWSSYSTGGDQPGRSSQGQAEAASHPAQGVTAHVPGQDSRSDPLQVSDPWRSYSDDHSRWRQGSDKWWSSSKGDFSEPPTWAGWQHYRLWKRAIQRWHRNTDVQIHRRAEKVLKTMEWSLQEKFEHLDEDRLSGPQYLEDILNILDNQAGEREDSEKRRSVRAALYEGGRRGDESLAQYAARRDAQFQMAAQHLQLPDELKAYMLEEQANLSKQSAQNLRVLTEGKADYQRVKKALQVIDVEGESLFKSGKTTFFETENYMASSLNEENDSDEDDDFPPELRDEIDAQDMDEEQVMSFLSLWEAGQTGRKRTWSENKLLKAARKKDRRHFDDKGEKAERPVPRRRLPVSELKKITRCSNCGMRGHWREECVRPYRSRSEREKTEGGMNANASTKGPLNAFVYLGLDETGASSSFSSYFGSFLSLFSVPAGHAIIDPGAAQDLIGEKHYQQLTQRLREVGLQPIELDEKPPAACGVGGNATALKTALSPCILGGKPGIVRLIVIEGDVPHLLSIGLLERAGTVIDTFSDQIAFKNFGTEAKMNRLPSGHRTIDIAKWEGGPFPVPPEVQKAFNLSPGAFNAPEPAVERAYMAASSVSESERNLVLEALGQRNQEGWTTDWTGRPALCIPTCCVSGKRFEEVSHELCASFPFRSSWHVVFHSDRPPSVFPKETNAASHNVDEVKRDLATQMEQITRTAVSKRGVFISIFSSTQSREASLGRSDAASSKESLFERSSLDPHGVCSVRNDGSPTTCCAEHGASPGSMVSDDSKDVVPTPWAGQHPCAALGGRRLASTGGPASDPSCGTLPSPHHLSCDGPQPVWGMETMREMLHQDSLPEVRNGRSSSRAVAREEGLSEGDDGDCLPDRAGASSCPSDGTAGRSFLFERGHLLRGVEGRDGAAVSGSDGFDDDHYEPAAGSGYGCRSADVHGPAADAGLDGPATDHHEHACPATGHHVACDGSRDGGGVGRCFAGGSEPRRALRVRKTPQSFTVLPSLKNLSLNCIDASQWFFCTLGRASLRMMMCSEVTSWFTCSIGDHLLLIFCSPS